MDTSQESQDMTPLERLGASRRRFLALAGAGGGAVALAACAGGGGGGSEDSSDSDVADGGGEKSDDNPFGVKDDSKVDIVIFDGGYGDEYAKDAGKAFEKLHEGVTAKVNSTVNIQPELQPRFVGGNPPDVFDNSGAQSMNISALINQGELAELQSLLDAKGVDGTAVKDTLLPGATEPGTYSGKFLAMNYVYTVYALWFSTKQFDKNGWSAPKTWDDMMSLGEEIKKTKAYPFSYGGQNASNYYQELALSMAIKEGGDEVRKKLDSLDAKAFEQDAVVKAYSAIEDAVKAKFFAPGGEGIKHTQAQTDWVTGKSVLYPSGSWIENEQRDVTPDDYAMTAAPVPLLSDGAKMPYEAIHGAAGEPFVVPSKAANGAGGLEFLRVMLSKEQATNFTKLTGSPTVVKDAAPSDKDASTALQATLKMISDAGTNTFTFNFSDWYDMGPDTVTQWTEFLSGGISAEQLREKQQKMFDKIREDDSIDKFDVK
ncbi:carbohydrate ABC transporter, N-acetylglucosamine/diacetylchitobiose-binding protein [Brachybacterium endophyticum]|uniref:Carbohydrate ABC transporter, N-acetylglucosamine/diacetylchitobiose-binding protein n=1 Tax=Brachybacterium endophyticum TaxID=2182385 RepID=A0A2U2RPQ0_9MICO|nr:N-acetylglucosamine/diacetylchitobiose ABC transporter substrate-binding protein [Brachybacterium endophyticum]PWH07785.1 carbohydrate ABC transporter, N-acetylglucosamine/diacetylchitobiose-binding protein [Brachybacterium endophyticum]